MSIDILLSIFILLSILEAVLIGLFIGMDKITIEISNIDAARISRLEKEVFGEEIDET